MTTKTNSVEAEVDEVEHNPFFEATRKIMLAAIGAVALGKDEMEVFIGKLIERGEIAEKDGRKLISEVLERRKKTAHGVKAESSKHIQEILDHLNVPTKKDIDDLSEKIAALARKIEELKKAQK